MAVLVGCTSDSSFYITIFLDGSKQKKTKKPKQQQGSMYLVNKCCVFTWMYFSMQISLLLPWLTVLKIRCSCIELSRNIRVKINK